MQLHQTSRPRQIVAIAALAAIAFIGCSDDGTPTVTIDEETYEAIGLAAADIASRGAITPFLLIQLGYFAIDGSPAPAIAAPGASRLPSAGSGPPDICDFGTVTVEFDEDDESATVDYHACLIDEGPPCFVHGRIEMREVDVDGESGVQAEATDLTVECEGLGLLSYDGDRVTCTDGPLLDGCEIELSEFEGPASEATLRAPELEMLGYLFDDEVDASGTGIDVDLGKFDFETVALLELDCDGLPSDGVILFGDPSSSDFGSIEFDGDCEEFEICLWNQEGEDPPMEVDCSSPLYPGMMPPP